MAVTVPVKLFNANPLPVTVTLNGGPGQWIGGTGAALRWLPQWQANPLVMNLTGPPLQNTLGLGPNALTITPKGVTGPTGLQIDLPDDIVWGSVQLYIFFDTTQKVGWLVLNAGQFVTGDLTQ